MDVVINIEPEEECEISSRNQQKPQKKRSCTIWFWLCLIIVPVVIGAGVTAYYLIPKGADPTPQPTTISPESSSSTTTPILPEAKTIPPIATTTTIPEVTTTTTIPEVTTTTTIPEVTTTRKPQIMGDWIKDVPMLIGNESRLHVSLIYGQLTHKAMLHMCTNSRDEKVFRRAAYFSNEEEETSFDGIIRANSATVFGNKPPYDKKRLLWTGCHYENRNKVWNTKCGQDPEIYNNFCNQPGWKNDLEQLKASTENKIIYIVKDFREDNSCWQLFDSEQLKSTMGKVKSDPILPFTCIVSKK